MPLDLFAMVRLKKDLPEEHLKAGALGAIVMIFDKPCLAYEVEFLDKSGRHQTTVALLPNQIESIAE